MRVFEWTIKRYFDDFNVVSVRIYKIKYIKWISIRTCSIPSILVNLALHGLLKHYFTLSFAHITLDLVYNLIPSSHHSYFIMLRSHSWEMKSGRNFSGAINQLAGDRPERLRRNKIQALCYQVASIRPTIVPLTELTILAYLDSFFFIASICFFFFFFLSCCCCLCCAVHFSSFGASSCSPSSLELPLGLFGQKQVYFYLADQLRFKFTDLFV